MDRIEGRMVGGVEISLWILLILASFTDLKSGIIPNRLTFTFLILGLIAQLYLGSWSGMGMALLSVLISFCIFYPFFLAGAFGAGDVKLLIAFSAWTTPVLTIELAVLSVLFGAAVGIYCLWAEKGILGSLSSMRTHLTEWKAHATSTRMAFAPAFLCAFCVLQIALYRNWKFFIW